MGAYWCSLANTIEPPMCGDSAAFCQITLSTCFQLSWTFAVKTEWNGGYWLLQPE